MVEIHHWEDDPKAEEIVERLKRRGISFEATPLDPEVPSARPSVQHDGTTFWDLSEYLRFLDRSHQE